MSARLSSNRSTASSRDKYGTAQEEHDEALSHRTDYLIQSDSDEPPNEENDGLMRHHHSSASTSSHRFRGEYDAYDSDDDSDDDSEYAMSIQELLYSSSSYHAIAKPVTLTMVLAALAVVFINNDETREEGEEAMASAYQVWNINSNTNSSGETLALSLANALVMVTVICAMTFGIVLLYKMRCMKCLIGYMMLCSGTLLGVLGGNMLQVAVHIYSIPVDKLTFFIFVYNFCIVGVVSVFWGQGIPKYVTQGYLIATSVILAWHISYFDAWTTWTLLFMLALYDLCAVLTPCGPLRALVNLMSEDEAPEMPGLLFEADLPPEAKRPGIPKAPTGLSQQQSNQEEVASPTSNNAANGSRNGDRPTTLQQEAGGECPTVNIPLAIAKVYNLEVVDIPKHSRKLMNPQKYNDSNVSASPLLQADDEASVSLPQNPTPTQLRAVVTVKLPVHGGRIEQVSKRGKRVYLERDRYGNPKRILWVDRNGKVFAEMREDDEEGPERNSIRLGLGDFIFYSVLVAKAAQYSFATFAACTLVILAGLGGTLVLLSVYHHALPALPISIFLGVIFYLMTRAFIEPWIEVVLSKPYYV